MTERDLVEGLARLAAPVVPGADPYGRLMRRHQRLRRARATGWTTAVIAAITAALLGPVGLQGATGPVTTLPSSSSSVYVPNGEPITPWVQRLIDSPTRGALAADTGFLSELTRLLREQDSLAIPSGQVKILFAEDVGGTRIVIAVRYNATLQIGIAITDERATTADQLAQAGTEGRENSFAMTTTLSPYFSASYSDANVAGGGYVSAALTPSGCHIASADATSKPLIWRDEPTVDYVVSERRNEWRKVTCDGIVHYEGPADNGPSSRIPRRVTEEEITAAIAAARGEVDPQQARVRLEQLRPVGAPKLLYMGRTPGGPADETAFTVAAARDENNRWSIMVADDRVGTLGFDTTVDLGAPDAVIAVEHSGYSWPTSPTEPTQSPRPSVGRILVLAPRSAVTLQVLGVADAVTSTVTLVDGVGSVPYAEGQKLRLRALDANGTMVGTGIGPLPPAPNIEGNERVDNWS